MDIIGKPVSSSRCLLRGCGSSRALAATQTLHQLLNGQSVASWLATSALLGFVGVVFTFAMCSSQGSSSLGRGLTGTLGPELPLAGISTFGYKASTAPGLRLSSLVPPQHGGSGGLASAFVTAMQPARQKATGSEERCAVSSDSWCHHLQLR